MPPLGGGLWCFYILVPSIKVGGQGVVYGLIFFYLGQDM